MTYQILDRPLKDGLIDRIPLRAEYLVIHSTANPGATDETHVVWLNGERRHGWAHYYADWDSISRVVPEGFVAPAQGPTANRKAISIEICEATTRDQFEAGWEIAVWLAADILHRYHWNTYTCIKSHADISLLYPRETDHTDPIGYFRKWGRSWDDFLANVYELTMEKEGLPTPEIWQAEAVTRLLHMKRENGEPYLTDFRHPRKPVEWWELALILQRGLPKE